MNIDDPSMLRWIRSGIRDARGSVRVDGPELWFSYSIKMRANGETAVRFVGKWDGRTWTPTAGPSVPCNDVQQVVELFLAGVKADELPPILRNNSIQAYIPPTARLQDPRRGTIRPPNRGNRPFPREDFGP